MRVMFYLLAIKVIVSSQNEALKKGSKSFKKFSRPEKYNLFSLIINFF